MTEVKESIPQDKVEINSTQPKVDTNLQKPIEQNNNNSAIPSTPAATNAEVAEDPNWRAFREARKKDRAEREAAEAKAKDKEAEVQALKAAMEAAFAKSPVIPPNQNGYDDPPGESEDERIEKKVQAALASREALYVKQMEERERQEYPQRLTKNFVDFNQVISQENLDYLDYHYPEISRPLQRLPDDYDKWADIYRAVKKFVPGNNSAKKDAAKAEANFNKPRSMSSSSITQPGEAASSARLTEEKRAANWARMQAVLKGVG